MTWRLLTLVFLPFVALPAQQQVRGMPAAPDVAVRFWIPAGRIEVQGWDRDSVDVRSRAAPGTRLDGGGDRRGVKFALQSQVDTILPSAQLQVRVPRRAKLWIKSTTATVEVTGVHGELEVLQVSGGTTILNGRGVATVESIDGAISVAGMDGTLRIRGGSALANVRGISGTVDISMISGGVSLVAGPDPGDDVSGRIETVTGPVEFRGATGGGRLDISTHEGAVTLSLLPGFLPLLEVEAPAPAFEPSVRAGNRQAGRISVRTFKGRVNAGLATGI
ncbi:MAG TPA: hypothetical protein PLL69_01965 [Gemmatimonadales bacterium]|nr:hypothetical protein [Gemmatimonadales bacterium]